MPDRAGRARTPNLVAMVAPACPPVKPPAHNNRKPSCPPPPRPTACYFFPLSFPIHRLTPHHSSTQLLPLNPTSASNCTPLRCCLFNQQTWLRQPSSSPSTPSPREISPPNPLSKGAKKFFLVFLSNCSRNGSRGQERTPRLQAIWTLKPASRSPSVSSRPRIGVTLSLKNHRKSR